MDNASSYLRPDPVTPLEFEVDCRRASQIVRGVGRVFLRDSYLGHH